MVHICVFVYCGVMYNAPITVNHSLHLCYCGKLRVLFAILRSSVVGLFLLFLPLLLRFRPFHLWHGTAHTDARRKTTLANIFPFGGGGGGGGGERVTKSHMTLAKFIDKIDGANWTSADGSEDRIKSRAKKWSMKTANAFWTIATFGRCP